jgi:ABC-type branched-subunit amino acid transport system substrate-binding protein
MVFNRRSGWMILAFLLSVVLAVPVWAADTFKICLLEVVSGPFKRSGDAYVLALEILAEEMNEKGGILGKKVEIIVEDSLNKPDVAVRKARKHIIDGVKVFATGTGTHNALALGELAAKEKVIFISYGAEGESLTGKSCNANTFRVSPNTEQRSMAIANFLATKPFKKFAIINQDYAFGHEAAEGFKRRIKQFIPNAQVVAEEFHPLALKDFGPYVSKVAAAKPDVIFTANWVVDLINVIKQSREMGIKVPFMCYYLYDPVAVLPGLGDTANGCWTCEGYFETVRTPGVKALLERWGKKPKYTEFQRTATGSIGRAYNGMKHFLEAVKKAKSLDVNKIIQTWEGMEWEGITGKMIMRPEDHQLLMPMFMAEIIPPTNEFYPNLPYLSEPIVISLEKSTVPLNETGCTRKKGQF